MRRAVIRVPASSANLGPGFDVFSVALEQPSLTVEAVLRDDGVFEVVNDGPYGGEVSSLPDEHAGARAARLMLRELGLGYGLSLKVDVRIPPRKGLGLSGAEAAGAVYALNELLGLGMDRERMVMYAARAEPGEHMDNVAASLMGGFSIAMRDSLAGGVVVRRVEPPGDLGLVVIIPDIPKASTARAREALPDSLARDVHVESAARCAVAAAALALGDLDLLLRAVSYDPYAEKARADAGVYGEMLTASKLLEEKKHLLTKFHVAETISGAGPSRLLWFKLSENRQRHGERPIDKAIDTVVSGIEESGYKVLEVLETRPSSVGCARVG